MNDIKNPSVEYDECSLYNKKDLCVQTDSRLDPQTRLDQTRYKRNEHKSHIKLLTKLG